MTNINSKVFAKYQIFENQTNAFIDSLKRRSKIQDIDESGIITLNYNQDIYPFSDTMVTLLIEGGFIDDNVSLDQLHKYLTPQDMLVDVNQRNNVMKSFYENNLKMVNLYRKFMSKIIIPVIGEDCYIQKTPTGRFNFPFSQGMPNRDYHTDFMLGHPPEEINVWLPFTDISKSRSFRILPLSFSLHLLEIYKYKMPDLHYAIWHDDDLISSFKEEEICVELKPGQVLLFDSRCIHAGVPNQSKYTRVNMDVRVLPIEDYDKLPFIYKNTGGRKSQFIPGEYYQKNPVRIG